MLDDQGIAALGLANSAYEQNDLAAAEQRAGQALDLARRRGNELLQVQATIRLAHIQASRGNFERASTLLKSLAAVVQNPAWLREVQDAQALLSIRANAAAPIDWWLELAARDKQGLLPIQKEREAFTLARWQIAVGQYQAALEALEGWEADAARQGRVRSQVEALCLQALAFSANQDPNRAAQALVEALRIGQSKGFRRLFLDEGAPMARLLQAALHQLPSRSLGIYASTLLHSFSPELVSGPAAGGAAVRVEPLSQQEARVLRLLVGGMSNAEIARELVVSINTVKTQVKSIYRKLDVTSREEARQVARELNLL